MSETTNDVSNVSIELRKKQWLEIEKNRKKKLITFDDNEANDDVFDYPLKVGGADLSFLQNESEEKAIACYVILEYISREESTPKVLYKDFKLVTLGFAVFCPFFMKGLNFTLAILSRYSLYSWIPSL